MAVAALAALESSLPTSVHDRIYRGLRLSQDQIRVLELQPAENLTDSLHVHLRVQSLYKSPHYEALSYTWGLTTSSWGESKLREKIYVGHRGQRQHSLLVTDNLANALRRLRRRDSKRRL
jgi:hypothetical protein